MLTDYAQCQYVLLDAANASNCNLVLLSFFPPSLQPFPTPFHKSVLVLHNVASAETIHDALKFSFRVLNIFCKGIQVNPKVDERKLTSKTP